MPNSKGSSPSSSRSSSNGRSGDAAPSASPAPQVTSNTTAGLELDAPDEKHQLFLLVLGGGAQAVKDFCEQAGPERIAHYCHEATFRHEDQVGSILYFAALYNKRAALKVLAGCLGTSGGANVDAVLPVLVNMLSLGRHPMVLYLTTLCPAASLKLIDAEKQENLFHVAFRAPRVPLWFVEEILAVMSNVLHPEQRSQEHHRSATSLTNASGVHAQSQSGVSHSRILSSSRSSCGRHKRPTVHLLNDRSAKGFTPLHIAAMSLHGSAAREIVKELLAYGADETLLTAKGQSVNEICNNGYIRQHLCILATQRRGRLPQLDPSVKEQIDACKSSESFPQLPEIREEDIKLPPTAAEKAAAAAAAASDDEGDARKKGAPLSQEEIDELVSRLFDQSVKQKSKWLAERYRELEEEDRKRYHSKQLSQEEVEASVARVFNESIEKHVEKMTELNGKYIRERPAAPVLEREDLEACCYRLCKGSQEKAAASNQQLTAKYSPPRESRKLSKGEMEASAQRLWRECQDKTGKEMSRLFEEYCCKERGRFNGGNGPLSPEKVKELADRLSKKA